MTLWSCSDVTVNRLRVSSRGGESLSLRLRANRTVAQTVSRPSGLPPSAILCIRRLVDPQPNTVNLDRDHSPPPEWTAAVSSSIAVLASRAARPGAGEVPADAEAVVFADWAELLACLAADWCQGRLRARWWWPALIGHGDLWRHAIRAWTSAPRYAAAALDQLDRRGWSAQFVATLTESETAAMLRMVLEGRGLPTSSPTPVPLDRPAAAATESCATTDPATCATSTARQPPWRPWVPDRQCAGLRLDQERLLGVSLALQRAPAHIVTPSFVEAALTWTPAREDSLPAVPARTGLPRDATAPAQVQAPSPDVVGPVAPTAEPAPTSRESPEDRRERAARATPDRLSETTDLPRVEPVSLHVDVGTPADFAAPATVAPVTELHSTACGGVFFLLNLGLRLGLYGDFTTPAQPGITLPIWDFVSMVGRRLAGAGVAADPIWRLLADLSGRRPGDPPGAGFDPPRAWRTPGVWLRPFPDHRAWQWSVSAGRLRVRHPAGFLLVDVPRSADESAARQLKRELAPYRAAARVRVARQRQRASGARQSSPLAAWTAWLLPYVRARLSAAMAGRAPRRTGPLLCRQPARVLITPAHLHVTFALETLPVEVRLSGLDRDPGWIPAAGRAVTFAFE
jgi:hypothetical protein